MKVAFVDAYKIRQTLDTDFNVIHTHETDPTQYSPKFYIPKGEVWIDHRFKKEAKYLLKVELDWFAAKNGPYHELREKVNALVRKNGKPPKFIRKSSKKDDLMIRYVDGSIIRRYIDPQFVCGGHGLVYDYVPKGEIWVDVLMDKRDIGPVTTHEITEYRLMQDGLDYDRAHDFATVAEKIVRMEHGAKYPGEPGYERGLTKKEFVDKYVKSYALY